MKKIIAILGLALFSQQSLAVLIADIDFLDIADSVDASVGTYETNFQAPGTNIVDSVADGNGASYIFSEDDEATVDLSFSSLQGDDLFDVADVDLTLLFVGDKGHAGTVTLLGGSLDGSLLEFNIGAGENYTGFNSQQGDNLFGIFSGTLDLNANLSGTFAGFMLDISGASAVPSLIGTTASAAAVVPVPAAVWLFGSGLVGLVGVARRRHG